MKRLWTIGIVILLLLSGCDKTENPKEPTSKGNRGYLLSDEAIDELYQYIQQENLAALLNREKEPLQISRQNYKLNNDVVIEMGETVITIHNDNATGTSFQYQQLDYYTTVLDYHKDQVKKQAYLVMRENSGQWYTMLYTIAGSYELWYDEVSGRITGKSLPCIAEACDIREEMHFAKELQEALIYEFQHLQEHILSKEMKESNIALLEEKLTSFIEEHGDDRMRSDYRSRYNATRSEFNNETLLQTSATLPASDEIGEQNHRILNSLQVMVENETAFTIEQPLQLTREMLYPFLHMVSRYRDCHTNIEKPEKDYTYGIACRYLDPDDDTKVDILEFTDFSFFVKEAFMSYVSKKDLEDVIRQVLGVPVEDALVQGYAENSVKYSASDQIFVFAEFGGDYRSYKERYLMIDTVVQTGDDILVKAVIYDDIYEENNHFIMERDDSVVYLEGLNYREEILGYKDNLQQWEYVLKYEGNELYRIVSASKIN